MRNRLIRMSELASSKGNPGLLPVSPATLWRWVKESRFPLPYKIGGCTVWDLSEVEEFLSNQASFRNHVSK